MELYIVRHGIAESAGPQRPDSQRALTSEGRDKMTRAGRGLIRMNVRMSLILTSPFVRARETAEILATAVGKPPVDIIPEFASGATPSAFLNVLHLLAEESSVGIVGHEPDLGWCLTSLLSLDPKRPIVSFRKGSIACLNIEIFPRSHQGTLQWFLQPSQLRQLGRSPSTHDGPCE